MIGLRRGEWLTGCKLGHDPQEKVLGILGMGGIGRALKKRTDTMGMKTIYHNRNKLSDELENGAEYVSFDELLNRSDVISLNLPLNVSNSGWQGNGWQLIRAGTHPPHHLHCRIRKDERRRRDRQHRSRSSNGRRRTREGA